MKTAYKTVGLTLNALDNSEFVQLILESKEALVSFNKTTKTETVYTKKLTELDTLLTAFQALIHKGKSSQHSKALSLADKERDAAFVTLKQLIKAFSRVKEENTQASYQRLRDLLKGYKTLEHMSYEKETESINFFLHTLKEEAYQADVTRLHLTPYVAALTTAQKAFEKVYKARLAEQEAQVPNQARLLRRKLQDLYEALVDYTAIYSYLNPELVAYQKLHTSLNAIRSRYRVHQTSHKKVKSEQVTEAIPSPES